MKQKLGIALFAFLVLIQILISALPGFGSIPQPLFSVIRLILQVLLWGGLGFLGYVILRAHFGSKYGEYFTALDNSVNSLLANLMKISSGDLSSSVDESNLFASRFSKKAITEANAGSLIDQSIQELNAITGTPLKRLSFTGGNSYLEGLQMGEQIAVYMRKSGVLLIVIPYFSQVLHALRAKGCISYLNQHAPGIKILPVVEGYGNELYFPELLEKQFSKNSSISGIYVTDGVTPIVAEKWLTERGKNRTVSLFAHDITEDNINMLKRGTLKALLAENFFAQAYNSAINLYNSLEAGWKPVSYKIYMDPLLVTPENYAEYWDSSKNDRILTETEQLSLVEPVPHTSGKRWKLGIVMPTLVTFFTMAAKGALAAKERLTEMGLDVEIVDSFKEWRNFAQREAMEPDIRNLVQRGIDGLSTVVFDRNLVPVLNGVVESGVTVTTFNSEPLNLRDIIMNVSENITTLQVNSQSLASSAEESARANEQIVKGMNSIEESTAFQNEELRLADESVSSLDGMIKNISSVIDNYTAAVERMNSEAGKGVEQVSETMQAFLELRSGFKQIDNNLNQLHGEMGRIRKIVSTIDTFSTDTNVLAINASIQAARAGEQGKAFAVVAKEIRSLSEKSSHATEEISHIIDSVISGVSGVVSVSNENMKQVEVSSERFSQVDTAFQVINQHLIESADAIRDVHSSIASAAESSGTIKTTMNKISSGNKTNLQSIQEISESLRELATQSSDLSAMAAQYLELANNQEKVISQLSI